VIAQAEFLQRLAEGSRKLFAILSSGDHSPRFPCYRCYYLTCNNISEGLPLTVRMWSIKLRSFWYSFLRQFISAVREHFAAFVCDIRVKRRSCVCASS
jgi:hypothetical protein